MNQHQIRTAVLIGSEIAATLATVIIVVRLVGGQDGFRSAKMKLAKSIEKQCMHNAVFWADMANAADHVYNNSRVVTL